MRWWQCGLVGAFTLCAATGVKALVIVPIALLRDSFPGVDVAHAAGFVVGIFAMGFICGVVGWAGRGLHRKIGWLGDSLTGLAIMLVFFLCCIIIFDPDMLGSNFRSGGLPMFCLAAVLGVAFGPWFARDLRSEFSQLSHQADRHPD